jgi:hypothetical protein
MSFFRKLFGKEAEPTMPRPTLPGADEDDSATAGIFAAARSGTLPPATGGRVGGLDLPAGRLFSADVGGGQRGPGPCLWISILPATGVDRTWSVLAGAFPETGLWPLIVDAEQGLDSFEEGLIDTPHSQATDVETVLRRWWTENVGPDEDEFDPATYAPFKRRFPGLAPRTPGPRPTSLDPLVNGMTGNLGLVAVKRPADVLGTIGWSGAANYDADPNDQSLLLRSWEDRFDAYLVGLGFDTVTLAIARPPTDRATATAIAAEHVAFCPDNIWQGVGTVRGYARELVGVSTWPFWWD